jgi:hypothetical protein
MNKGGEHHFMAVILERRQRTAGVPRFRRHGCMSISGIVARAQQDLREGRIQVLSEAKLREDDSPEMKSVASEVLGAVDPQKLGTEPLSLEEISRRIKMMAKVQWTEMQPPSEDRPYSFDEMLTMLKESGEWTVPDEQNFADNRYLRIMQDTFLDNTGRYQGNQLCNAEIWCYQNDRLGVYNLGTQKWTSGEGRSAHVRLVC